MKLLSENTRPIEAIAPATGAEAIAGDYISMKNTSGVTIYVHITQGNAATVALTLYQATAVAGTGEKALAKEVPIFANQDCAASDVMTAQTAAVSFTTSATLKHKLVAFEVPVEALDIANGFDCLCVKAGASNAANIIEAKYVAHSLRYNNKSMITD